MRISKVQFSNFCQYETFESDLSAGVVGVIGKNGAGKSNFLRGIRRALTGVSGNVGNKEDDLRWGATKGYVRAGFSVHTGEEGWVQRNLTSAGGRMSFGGKEFKTHAEIEQNIYDILGASPKVLNDFVLVEQGQIEAILFGKQAERQKSLQHLFGTQQAELIREYLQTEISTMVPQSRSEAIQKTRVKLDELEKSLKLCREQQDIANARLLSKDTLELYKGLVARYEAQQAALRASSQADQQVAEYEAELKAETAALQALQASAVEYADILTGLEEVTKHSHQLVEKYGRAESIRKAREHAELQMEGAAKMLEEKPPKPPTAGANEALAFMRERKAQLGERHRVSLGIAQMTLTMTCPTCEQPITKTHVEYHSRLSAELFEEIRILDEKITKLSQEITAYEDAKKTFEQRQQRASTTYQGVEKLLGELPSYEEVAERELKEAHEAIELYSSVKQTYQSLSQDVKVSESKVDSLRKSLERALSTRAGLSTSLGDVVTEVVYRETCNHLLQCEIAIREAGEATGRLNAMMAQRTALLTELGKYEKEEMQLGQIKAWRDTVERARGLLHREQLPAVVAKVFLDGINRHLARYLEIFEVPFTACITPEEVICSFGGKTDVPAGRLSGGQKVMLGLAFRFAIYDQFVSSLGLLMLDEPTVYLDDDHVDVAVELLSRIKSYSKGAGLQLIVVTHDQRLASVFDQTIRV